MVPAVMFQAVSFTIQIYSFKRGAICEAEIRTPIEGMENQILTPECAEMLGINLSKILDTGCKRKISLGEELQDWRAFKRCPQKNVKLMKDAVWLESESRAVWINPRIQEALNGWNQNGFIVPTYLEQLESKIDKAELQPMAPINQEWVGFQYQPQLPILPYENGDGIMEDWNSCSLWIAAGKKKEKLSNFIPLPVRREYHFKATGEREIVYEICVYVYGFKTVIRVAENKLNTLYSLIKETVDSAVICVAKANIFLERYVREHLALLHQNSDIAILTDAGWQLINGQSVFAFDNRDERFQGFLFSSGRVLYAESVSSDVAWQYFMQAQSISEDRRITSIVILYSLMGLLFSVFKQSGFTPQFLLYIVGTTGSLKTALAKVFFDIFNGENKIQVHSFSDTITALELYLGALKDEVGIVDDLELGDSESESRRQREIFNMIVRLVGDTKGKNRSNPSLKDVKAKVTQGLVAITGEQSLGKQSNRLRMIELEVTKGAILGERLAILQDNPMRWGTVCGMFIGFVEENYSEVLRYISTKARSFRQEYQNKFDHLRTVDQLVSFRIIAELLRQMWTQKLQNLQIVNEALNDMIDAVEAVLTTSVEMDEIENPGIRFLMDLDALIGAGSILIAENSETFFKSTAFSGYFEFGDIFLLKDTSYEAVTNYEQRMRRRFPFDMTKILKSLSEFDAVYSFANGKSRTFNVRKEGRTFFKINGKVFRQKVELAENNLY